MLRQKSFKFRILLICLIFYCIVKNKDIAMGFYNMDWFMLPVSLQRHVLLGIHDIQNGAVLTMGPLGMIDFEKATDVCSKSMCFFVYFLSIAIS